MSQEDIDRIKRNVAATLMIEGLKPSDFAVMVNDKFLHGEITKEQAVESIKDYYLGVE